MHYEKPTLSDILRKKGYFMPENIMPSAAAQPRVAALLACGHNLMALSWHMPVSKSPFRYAVAVREENHSHRLIRERGSFTLNFLPFEQCDIIDKMGRFHGDTFDKLALSELAFRGTDAEGNVLVDSADFIYECRLVEEATWGGSHDFHLRRHPHPRERPPFRPSRTVRRQRPLCHRRRNTATRQSRIAT